MLLKKKGSKGIISNEAFYLRTKKNKNTCACFSGPCDSQTSSPDYTSYSITPSEESSGIFLIIIYAS